LLFSIPRTNCSGEDDDDADDRDEVVFAVFADNSKTLVVCSTGETILQFSLACVMLMAFICDRFLREKHLNIRIGSFPKVVNQY